MPNRWALWLVWLFIELAWPGLVLAADACSDLFFNPCTQRSRDFWSGGY